MEMLNKPPSCIFSLMYRDILILIRLLAIISIDIIYGTNTQICFIDSQNGYHFSIIGVIKNLNKRYYQKGDMSGAI